MFFKALARTGRTLSSQHFMGLLIRTAMITLLCFVLFMMGSVAALRSIDFTDGGFLEWVIDVGLSLGAGFAMWLLLPIMVPAIAAFFQERIANTIEQKDYPEFMPPAVQRPFVQEMLEDIKFILLMIGFNILFLPTYFLIFPYYILNGYLIGREFFETVAARHMGKKKAKELRKNHPAPAFLCGMVIVFCTNIPGLNLVAPFIGVAIMVHLYHLLPKREEVISPPQLDA